MITRLPPVHVTDDGADAWATFEIYEENGETICGLYQFEGSIDHRPKAWLRLVRKHVAQFEAQAKAAGCVEFRIAGRDWSRVLPDYEPLPGGKPNRIRKRL